MARWTSGLTGKVLLRGTIGRGRNISLPTALDFSVIKTLSGGGNGELVLAKGIPASIITFADQTFELEVEVNAGEELHFIVDGNGSLSGSAMDLGVVIYNADSDNDGLSDLIESNIAGNLTAIDGVGDFDGDSFTNLQEFLLGTNPEDGTDYFRVVTSQRNNSDGSFSLTWPSKETLTYSIERSLSSNNFTWEVIASGVSGDQWTDESEEAANSDQAFYRVFTRIE